MVYRHALFKVTVNVYPHIPFFKYVQGYFLYVKYKFNVNVGQRQRVLELQIIS